MPGRVAVEGLRRAYGVGRGSMCWEDCCWCCADDGGGRSGCCCEDAEREAETTAERGGSVRELASARLPEVGGRLELVPGRTSPRAGSGRPKLNVEVKGRKEWVEVVEGARKDWPGSRKEWLLLGLESGLSKSVCWICHVAPW